MANSDRDWQQWGQNDPYFGVLADPRFRRDRLAGHREDFFASGQAQVEALVAAAEDRFGRLARRRALDFGCGVGRLALPLAQLFDEVVALDIAEAMLDEARANAAALGRSNILFSLSDDALSAAAGRFDFVISVIVLQHIPVRRGMAILRGLLERVEMGGVAAIHLCTARNDSAGQAFSNWLRLHVPGAHGAMNLVRGRRSGEPLMQMNAYPLQAVQDMAKGLGFGPCLVEPQMHGRFMTAQLLMQRERA